MPMSRQESWQSVSQTCAEDGEQTHAGPLALLEAADNAGANALQVHGTNDALKYRLNGHTEDNAVPQDKSSTVGVRAMQTTV